MTPGRAVVALTRERPVLATTWYTVAGLFLARALITDDPRVWAYLTFLTGLTGVLAVTDRAVGFSDRALWLLLVAGTVHLCCGLLPGWDGHRVLYDAWIVPGTLRVDQVVHAFGSGAATVVMWELVGTYVRHDVMTPRAQAALAALGALGKGALNEVLEFLLALTFSDTVVGGFTNTGWDLTFNLVGAGCAATLLVASGARRRPLARSSRVGRPVDEGLQAQAVSA